MEYVHVGVTLVKRNSDGKTGAVLFDLMYMSLCTLPLRGHEAMC